MPQRLQQREINMGKGLVIAGLGIALTTMAAGQAALTRMSRSTGAISPAVRQMSAGAIREDSRDAGKPSVELMALAAFDRRVAGDRGSLADAADLRQGWQGNERRGGVSSHPYHGGTGRWVESPPDLMHTALTLRAMLSLGVSSSDDDIRRAVTFISRCQIADDSWSERGTSDQDLGGFAPVPLLEPVSVQPVARPRRPNGLMTCLGISSLLAAGVAPDDLRVRRALRWLEVHYGFDSHPGMTQGREGLYGFYYEFANTMVALRLDRIRDARGVLHDWRKDLGQRLAHQQHPDGSWTNPEESPDPAGHSPTTITSLALMTLCQLRP